MREFRITYERGITRSPSDFSCHDGDLGECINLTQEGGELKPLHLPTKLYNAQTVGSSTFYLKCVHQTSYGKILVGVDNVEDNSTIYYREENEKGGFLSVSELGGKVGKESKFVQMGNTLIVQTELGVYYLIYKNGKYTYIGNRIPEPKMEFRLGGAAEDRRESYRTANHSGSYLDILDGEKNIKEGAQDKYNDLVVGLYLENRNSLKKDEFFSCPFFVRYALKMKDGTFHYISNPIFVPAFMGGNSHADFYAGVDKIRLNTMGTGLFYKCLTDYTNYEDLVEGIAVFASEEIELYDLNADHPHPEQGKTTYSQLFNGKIIVKESDICTQVLKLKSTEDITDECQGVGNYYKLFELRGKTKVEEWKSSRGLIKPDTLLYLNQQERLDHDDYYSRCPIIGKGIYAYNNRLNIANIKRGFFEGFDFFLPYEGEEASYTCYVHLDVGGKEVVKKHEYTTMQKQGYYFYYPDTRAKKALIYQGEMMVASFDLTAHQALNGAQYMKSYDGILGEAENIYGNVLKADEEGKVSTSITFESLGNRLIQSEVNNPFVFNVSGYAVIGSGEIIGMAAVTTALTQCNFGSYPLMVFCTDGVWAASLDEEGKYKSVVSVSREVCSDTESILQTDNSIYFISKKGLMRTEGVNFVCVSEDMKGKPFSVPSSAQTGAYGIISLAKDTESIQSYLEGCRMAYDYSEGKIVLLRKDKTFSYVIDVKTGAMGKMAVQGVKFIQSVNNYPDTLLQDESGNIYTLYYSKKDDEIVSQMGFLMTRPLKLDDPMAVKTIRQLLHVGTSDVKMKLYASDDLKNWYEKEGRFGYAAKYFSVAAYTNMGGLDRYTGMVVETDLRRTEHFKK